MFELPSVLSLFLLVHQTGFLLLISPPTRPLPCINPHSHSLFSTYLYSLSCLSLSLRSPSSQLPSFLSFTLCSLSRYVQQPWLPVSSLTSILYISARSPNRHLFSHLLHSLWLIHYRLAFPLSLCFTYLQSVILFLLLSLASHTTVCFPFTRVLNFLPTSRFPSKIPINLLLLLALPVVLISHSP